MKKWLNYLPTIFILSIVLSLVFYSSQGSTVQMNYTQFEKIVDEVDFKKSSMTISSTVIHLEGTYEQNSKTVGYKVIVPRTEKNIEKLEKSLQRNGGKLTVEDPNQGSVWISILSQIIPFLIIAVFFYFMFAKMGGGGNNKAFEFAKSKARVESNVKVRFKDVAGCEEEKEEVKEIIDYLRSPKKFTDMGAHIPKGILMVGPPGTGKTLLAKAVAGEANVPFFSISGSDFVEMFVGTGASRVRDMFKTAQKSAPCIIFIDEIDAVGRQRGAGMGGGNDEREQTLNQLLVEMDGMTDNAGIVVIAATNRPDVLDPALLRSGRFDRRVTVSLPDIKGREAILHVHARNKKLASDVSLANLAKRTPGFSGADLANVLNEGAILAVRKNEAKVTMTDLDEAIDRVMMGPAKKSKKYTEKDKILVAYHEAGHAVIGIKLEDAQEVHKITIIPRGMAGGYTMMLPKEEKIAVMTKDELLAQITGLLGGRVSEEMFLNEISTGASDDFKKATRIARSMVTEYGMSDLGPVQYEEKSENVFLGRDYAKSRDFSDQVALEIDEQVRKIIESCYTKAKKIIGDNKDLIFALSDALIKYETITKEQIESIVETGEIKSVEEIEQEEKNEEVKETKKKIRKTKEEEK